MGTKHFPFRINWLSRHTASCWHATGLWPLYAYRRNTTGCFVWMLPTLDLTTLLSGEAWRINSHSMDFPTSPAIHSSHSLRPLFLSCTTCCLISASWLFDLFPLSNGIFIILEKKRLSNHPCFLSDASCAQISSLPVGEICSDICGYPSLWMPESLFLQTQLSSHIAEKVCMEIATSCAKMHDSAKTLCYPREMLGSWS